ncbi:electron transport protein [Neobacillus drentensis]|uniref:electron transport protein n=1 Tax=Neobacillus drentensis TaxID=220684 RepID=UPI002FFDA0AA
MKWAVGIFCVLLGIGVIRFMTIEYAYTPPDEKIVNLEGNQMFTGTSLAEGGTDKQIKLGRKEFFEETFGNEVFFTDIMGLFNGPFTLGNITKALIKLNGEGTSNLKVEAAKSFQAGNITIKKGDLIDTGLDVAKGSYIPLGMKFVYDQGSPKIGLSCAACHATVTEKGTVRAGAPNTDLNIGLTLAMASNTAAYFTHTEMHNIKDFIEKNTGSDQIISLPNKQKLEKFVDSEVVKWPRGSNDTTIDFKNNPVQVPDAYTKGDHPYGWSGQGQIGPFKGLSAAINNAHSQNMDTLSQSEISRPVLNIDKDLYLGTILQNAANKKYRYDHRSGIKPSHFFVKVDPTPGIPGVLRLVQSATYPKISYLSSVGLLPSSPGYKAWEQINAMSAYMNSLSPGSSELKIDTSLMEEGKTVFAKANCISCHAGDYLTSNRLIGVNEIKTEPSRAKAFKKTELYFSKPKMYKEDTPVPLPKNPKTVEIKLTSSQKKMLDLGWAHGNSRGGYKVPSLYGLNQSAPYLHDGGVSVGSGRELGISNTLNKGVKADPFNSLQALIDSGLRKQVVEANLSSPAVKSAHVTGQGHEYWVDESTGFTNEQQKALIYYLLRVSDK